MKKNIKMILVSLILLNAMTACTKIDDPDTPDQIVEVIERSYFRDYKWIESIEDDVSLLIVEPSLYTDDFRVLNSKLIATESSKFVWTPGRMPFTDRKGTYELSYLDSVEKFSVALFTPVSKSIVYEIDIVNFLNENKDYRLSSPTVTGYEGKDGINYISLSLYKLMNKLENDEEVLSETKYLLLINPATSDLRIVENNELSEILSYASKGRLSLIDSTNIATQNGVDFKYGYFENVHRFTIDCDKLPQHNSKLNAAFPELSEDIRKSLTNSQSEAQSLSFYFFNSESSFEVLSYFIEDDKEIVWDGVRLSGDLTVDGVEHEIHSVEDYIQFYKYIDLITKY